MQIIRPKKFLGLKIDLNCILRVTTSTFIHDYKSFIVIQQEEYNTNNFLL